MSFFIIPILLLAGLSALGAIIFSFAAWRSKNRRESISLLAVVLTLAMASFTILALTYPELLDGRLRTYKSFYQDIQVGMTREEVFKVLARHYPISGDRKQPRIAVDRKGELWFFMDPETTEEPDCEGIFLGMQDDRVSGKVYSPD